jgi:hypothetical protein
MKHSAHAMESFSWSRIRRAKKASEWMASGVEGGSLMGVAVVRAIIAKLQSLAAREVVFLQNNQK